MGMQGEGYAGLHMETVKGATGNDTSLVDKNRVERKKAYHKEKII